MPLLAMLSRRRFSLALAAGSAAALVPSFSSATTAVGFSVDDLVRRSHRVLIATPAESASEWASFGGTRRIVTLTRALAHEDWLEDGDDPEQELIIRTLGGRVGDFAQKVMGEAALRKNEPCLLFAGASQGGHRALVAMAQGHYPLERTDAGFRLRKSPFVPQLVLPQGGAGQGKSARHLAVERLHHKSLSEARRLVQSAAQETP